MDGLFDADAFAAPATDLEREYQAPPDRTGSRGGSTSSYEEGADRVEAYRGTDVDQLRYVILARLLRGGQGAEIHADDVADVMVIERNAVGVAFGSLKRMGLIVETGRRRASHLKAAHGRRSDLYRLTELGRQRALDAVRQLD